MKTRTLAIVVLALVTYTSVTTGQQSVTLVAPVVDTAPALTEVEQLRIQLARAYEDVRVARAARADCEATLGPVEAQLRGRDLETRYAALKSQYEKDHPGWTLSLERDTFMQPVKKDAGA